MNEFRRSDKSSPLPPLLSHACQHCPPMSVTYLCGSGKQRLHLHLHLLSHPPSNVINRARSGFAGQEVCWAGALGPAPRLPRLPLSLLPRPSDRQTHSPRISPAHVPLFMFCCTCTSVLLPLPSIPFPSTTSELRHTPAPPPPPPLATQRGPRCDTWQPRVAVPLLSPPTCRCCRSFKGTTCTLPEGRLLTTQVPPSRPPSRPPSLRSPVCLFPFPFTTNQTVSDPKQSQSRGRDSDSQLLVTPPRRAAGIPASSLSRTAGRGLRNSLFLVSHLRRECSFYPDISP